MWHNQQQSGKGGGKKEKSGALILLKGERFGGTEGVRGRLSV